MSYRAQNLPAEKHCFFGAEGGISAGIYASLNTNLSSRDSRNNILCNFERIAAHFGMQQHDMATVRQSVSDIAVWVEAPTWFETAADAMATNNPDILLGIKTADCAPVLLADYQNGVIGAAHAGWRGAYKGVIENAVALMVAHGAKVQNIVAAIGPCMQQKSFAVQADMRDVLLAQNTDYARFFITQDDHTFYFDLSGFAATKLRGLGIQNIDISPIDTYSDAGYFSFRRNTHLGLIKAPKDYPTQFSCIRL